MLDTKELDKGNVSMEIVSTRMGRNYSKAEKIRKVIQSIFHMVNSGYHVVAIGWIQPDDTVKGGTGWGVELAKLFNRPVSVFDQESNQWFAWKENRYGLPKGRLLQTILSSGPGRGISRTPVEKRFATCTRNLSEPLPIDLRNPNFRIVRRDNRLSLPGRGFKVLPGRQLIRYR